MPTKTSATADGSPAGPDPFGTAQLRAQALGEWEAAPERFRADANLAEDMALAYRDRVVVELAQNAADAAVRAGIDGRLALTARDDRLYASNVGAPLDRDGVVGLAGLRASPKRAHAAGLVGRFGVGFQAVLALSDAPEIRSAHGGVRFDAAAALEALRAAAARAAEQGRPGLAAELARRTELAGGSGRPGLLPLLRLPWPAHRPPEPGSTTTVVLPLRDARAAAAAREQLTAVGPALLLALPALGEVTVDVDGVVRVLTAVADHDTVTVVEDGQPTRWHTVTATRAVHPDWLADRPLEERARTHIALTWALPIDAEGAPAPWPASLPRVAHAPTPSEEPLTLPALLVADLPMDPTRRHVAPGRLADAVVQLAAEAYAGLAAAVPDPRLVPRGLPAGELDARVREAVLGRLRRAAFLPGGRRPRDCVVIEGVDEALAGLLGDLIPPTLPPAWARDRTVVDLLDVPVAPLADLVDALASARRPPRWWWELYEAMEHALTRGAWTGPAEAPVDRLDELGALPVPLVDGRIVRGPRGVLTVGPGTPELPDVLRRLPLRVADPQATHPLLTRLGAREASAVTLLDDPALPAAVQESPDDRELAAAVLGLVAAAGPQAMAAGHRRRWLARLAIPDEAGGSAAPDELCLPGSPVARAARPGEYGTVDPSFVERVGVEALRTVGVRAGYPVLRLTDWGVGLDDERLPGETLDGLDAWLADVARGAGVPAEVLTVPELAVIADLDLVDDTRPSVWVDVLDALADDPATRSAVVEPVRVLVPGGAVSAPSYPAWWVRRHAQLSGRPLTAFRLPGESLRGVDALLAGLYEPWPARVPARATRLLSAVGVRVGLAELLAEPDGPGELVTRLADPAGDLTVEALTAAMTALAEASADETGRRGGAARPLSPPPRLRAVVGAGTATVDADQVVVVDRPDLLPVLLTGRVPHLRVPWTLAETVADLLDVDLASERYGVVAPVDGVPRDLPGGLPGDLTATVAGWWEHERLTVAGVEVDWLVCDGQLHATTMAGLARAAAWASGRWERRGVLTDLLTDPGTSELTVAEAALDRPVAPGSPQRGPRPPVARR